MKSIAAGVFSVLVSTALFACSAGEPQAVSESASAVVEPAAETGLYAGICGFSLAGYDPNLAIRFLVTSSLENDQLTLGIKPLVGWNANGGGAAPPATVGESTTCGTTSTATSPVTKGAFSARYAELDLPGEANSITGDPIRLEDVRLDGILRKENRFCSGIAAMMTAPLQYELLREENTCIFVKIADGDPLPALTPEDFHCP
jgi:hypothetical protein